MTLTLTADDRAALATFLGGGPLTDREVDMLALAWESACENENEADPDELNARGRAGYDAAKTGSLRAFLDAHIGYDDYANDSEFMSSEEAETDREEIASVIGYYLGSYRFRAA